ncbi:MAG: DUF4394 domain-containing protein [Planctomycetia bacterium]|nr:DUF4394 domain-containing protein [Planctomycetia bacterium]
MNPLLDGVRSFLRARLHRFGQYCNWSSIALRTYRGNIDILGATEMRLRWFCALTALVLMGSAGETANAEKLVGLGGTPNGQSLVIFDSATPGTVSSVAITGLADGESLWGIDRRPATGELLALSNQNRLLTIRPNTGFATVVGAGFTNPLDGSSFGFDFNPQIDRIRIVSDANQNFVANPITGDANVAATTPVFFAVGDVNAAADPHVVHHAYDQNVAGTLATQLRAIDTDLDILVTQANNVGTLGTIGPLGFDATDIGGFDVSDSGNAFAIFNAGGNTSGLYSINLTSGAGTFLGEVPGAIHGLTAVPEPSTFGLLAIALTMGGAFAARHARRGR